MDESIQKALQSCLDRYVVRQSLYTVAFFKQEGGKASQFGSGVLLRAGGAYFVVTASHVIDVGVDQVDWPYMEGVPVFIGVGETSPYGISLSGHRILRMPEPWDVALIDLNEADATLLMKEHLFLDLAHCDLGPLDKDDAYLILGFPSEDSVTDEDAGSVTSMLHGFFTAVYCGERGEVPVGTYFKPSVNVTFDHDPSDLLNYEGEPSGFPRPGGASGCGIWKLGIVGRRHGEWNPEDARLVAIFQSIHAPTKTTIGTLLFDPLLLLLKSRVELRPVFNAAFPLK